MAPKTTGQKKKLHTGRHASAIKRARQSETRRRYNRKYMKVLREAVKAVRVALGGKKAADAKTALKAAIPVIAQTARRGVIPKPRADRQISRLTTAVNKLAA